MIFSQVKEYDISMGLCHEFLKGCTLFERSTQGKEIHYENMPIQIH